MSAIQKKDKKKRFICLCNSVSQAEIEGAIERGCSTLGKIFDATRAGVGACGGSCQPLLRKLLETYQNTGCFPKNPVLNSSKRRRQG